LEERVIDGGCEGQGASSSAQGVQRVLRDHSHHRGRSPHRR
jgi:hypothetical protein